MLSALVTAVLSSECSPTSASGLDASSAAVHEALNSNDGIEILVGKGPYLWWNEVPSQPPPGGLKVGICEERIRFFPARYGGGTGK